MLSDDLASITTVGSSDLIVQGHRAHHKPHWKLLTTAPAGTPVTVSYDANTTHYTATVNGQSITRTYPIRVTPVVASGRVTISNLENRTAWNPAINDNSFKGSVELIYSADHAAPVVINILPIEQYMQGISETGSGGPTAFTKAILVAARSYALYTKHHTHKGDVYALDTTEGSQVYRGANFSDRAPDVVAAVKATRGKIVTYQGQPVITPYFSSSDGRTRSWSEVWSGDYPWLQSVSDPCCTTHALLGHGVGMSGDGAMYFADKGWGYKKILKYYYTGVEVEKRY